MICMQRCDTKARSAASERHAIAMEKSAAWLADLIAVVNEKIVPLRRTLANISDTAILGDLSPQRALGVALSARRHLGSGVVELLGNADVVRVSSCPECLSPQERHCTGCGTCLNVPKVYHLDDCENS